MLDQEVASLVHFIKPLKLIEYFGEVPEGAATPSVYYPVPEMDGNESSLSTYKDSFALFVKIFDKDTLSSYSIASKIVEMVQSAGKKIPLYDEDGKPTGRCFRLNKVNTKNIDYGTTQIYFSWDVRRPYFTQDEPKAEHMIFDGLPISESNESEEGIENG